MSAQVFIALREKSYGEHMVKTFLEEMEDPQFAILIFTILLSAAWFVDNTLWSSFTLLVISYDVSGAISYLWSQARTVYRDPLLPGLKHEAKGHAFMFFLGYIMIAAILNSYLSKWLVAQIYAWNTAQIFGITIPYFSLVLINFLVVLGTYWYFHVAVFKKRH